MSAPLYLTHTRAALLALIRDGSIVRDPASLTIRYELRREGCERHNLTARTADAIRVDWACEQNYAVVLRPKGRAVLAEYEKERANG